MPIEPEHIDGMPDCIEDLRAAINKWGEVHNETATVGRLTIDFSTTDDNGLSLMAKASAGRYGSSVVVDTTNAEVVTGTIRLGDLALPEGADLFLAKVEVEKLIDKADPPATASTIDDDAGLYVRMRSMAGNHLAREGDDIVHVELNARMDIKEFTDWYRRFIRVYNREKASIRERTIELGASEDEL
jgi:hypothetical protein